MIRSGGGAFVIGGADYSGTLYGCLSLADDVKALGKLPDTVSRQEQPEMVLRGTCIGLQKTTLLPGRGVYEYPITEKNFPWFYDKKRWIRYLDMMVGLDKHYLAKYDIDANRIAGLIPFSGQCITHFTIRDERGIKGTQPIIDNMAPLYFVRADAPPMLLITGDREMELLGRYEENAYMLRMMKLCGNTTTRLLEEQGYDHGGMPTAAFPLLVKEVARLTKAKKG